MSAPGTPLLGVTAANGFIEMLPFDQSSQAHRLVACVDHVVEPPVEHVRFASNGRRDRCWADESSLHTEVNHASWTREIGNRHPRRKTQGFRSYTAKILQCEYVAAPRWSGKVGNFKIITEDSLTSPAGSELTDFPPKACPWGFRSLAVRLTKRRCSPWRMSSSKRRQKSRHLRNGGRESARPHASRLIAVIDCEVLVRIRSHAAPRGSHATSI